MTKIFLFNVKDCFQLTNLGLAVAPGLPLEYYDGPIDLVLLLKKPNGQQAEANAKIFYPFFVPTPDNKMLTVLFPDLTKNDIPIGTDVWFIHDKCAVNSTVDWMSILIEKNSEKQDVIDYIFICDVWTKDPRHKRRNICIGQNRGLFRINKQTTEAQLLLPMDGDRNGERYLRAASKIINEYKKSNLFPDRAHFACG